MNRLVVMYGPSGSGKTRLLKRISGFLQKRMSMKVLHSDAQDVCDATVKAIACGSLEEYCASLAGYDALLIDNIWVLSRRPTTARKVMSMLVALARDGKQVLIASDVSPVDLARWMGHSNASRLFRIVPASGDMVSPRPTGTPLRCDRHPPFTLPALPRPLRERVG